MLEENDIEKNNIENYRTLLLNLSLEKNITKRRRVAETILIGELFSLDYDSLYELKRDITNLNDCLIKYKDYFIKCLNKHICQRIRILPNLYLLGLTNYKVMNDMRPVFKIQHDVVYINIHSFLSHSRFTFYRIDGEYKLPYNFTDRIFDDKQNKKILREIFIRYIKVCNVREHYQITPYILEKLDISYEEFQVLPSNIYYDYDNSLIWKQRNIYQTILSNVSRYQAYIIIKNTIKKNKDDIAIQKAFLSYIEENFRDIIDLKKEYPFKKLLSKIIHVRSNSFTQSIFVYMYHKYKDDTSYIQKNMLSGITYTIFAYNIYDIIHSRIILKDYDNINFNNIEYIYNNNSNKLQSIMSHIILIIYQLSGKIILQNYDNDNIGPQMYPLTYFLLHHYYEQIMSNTDYKSVFVKRYINKLLSYVKDVDEEYVCITDNIDIN